MAERISLNGNGGKATKTNLCQAKACGKPGSLRYFFEGVGKGSWTYFMCDEHVRVLTERDKKYIARTEGTKEA